MVLGEMLQGKDANQSTRMKQAMPGRSSSVSPLWRKLTAASRVQGYPSKGDHQWPWDAAASSMSNVEARDWRWRRLEDSRPGRQLRGDICPRYCLAEWINFALVGHRNHHHLRVVCRTLPFGAAGTHV